MHRGETILLKNFDLKKVSTFAWGLLISSLVSVLTLIAWSYTEGFYSYFSIPVESELFLSASFVIRSLASSLPYFNHSIFYPRQILLILSTVFIITLATRFYFIWISSEANRENSGRSLKLICLIWRRRWDGGHYSLRSLGIGLSLLIGRFLVSKILGNLLFESVKVFLILSVFSWFFASLFVRESYVYLAIAGAYFFVNIIWYLFSGRKIASVNSQMAVTVLPIFLLFILGSAYQVGRFDAKAYSVGEGDHSFAKFFPNVCVKNKLSNEVENAVSCGALIYDTGDYIYVHSYPAQETNMYSKRDYRISTFALDF